MTACLILATVILLPQVQERSTEPDPATAKEITRQIKELFKEDYARKSPADQRALVQKLYSKALESKDDRTAAYVFLQESRDVATGCGDVEMTVRACDDLSKAYTIDGPGLKIAALGKIASSSRDSDTARACGRALLAAVPEAFRAENFEAAAAACQKAESLAKTAQESTLASRAVELKAETASLKSEAGRVRPLLEKPGPGDYETIGRYQCFVKGDWESGIPNLLAGPKSPLRVLAERDAAKPADPDKQLETAEGWIELGQKEKSSWRRSQILAHARRWLEQALPNANGVVKLRIEKRLGDVEDLDPGAINLLRFIDPRLDSVLGEWTFEGSALVSPSLPWARLQIPYSPPDEYELTLVVERKQGDNALGIGLVHGTPFAVFLDGFPGLGGKSGLDLLDNTVLEKNPATVTGLFIKNNVSTTIVVSVRRTGVTVSVDSKAVINWQGNYNRLAPSPVWKPKDNRMLLVGAFESKLVFSRIILTPLGGQGKKLR